MTKNRIQCVSKTFHYNCVSECKLSQVRRLPHHRVHDGEHDGLRLRILGPARALQHILLGEKRACVHEHCQEHHQQRLEEEAEGAPEEGRHFAGNRDTTILS